MKFVTKTGDPSQDEYIDRDGDTANAFYIVNDKRAEQAHAEKMAAACNSPLIADNSVRPKARRWFADNLYDEAKFQLGTAGIIADCGEK